MFEFDMRTIRLEARLLAAAELIGIGPEGPESTDPGDGGLLGIDYSLPDDYITDHLNTGTEDPNPLVPGPEEHPVPLEGVFDDADLIL